MIEPAGFEETVFNNGYKLVDGVEMNRLHGERFAVVNPWFKKHVREGEFVEIRIDSDRFSAHPDASPGCDCELCGEEATKPILSHEQPLSLLEVPRQPVPARGWGEEFWVCITEREDTWLRGEIDNYLYESKLHGLDQGTTIVFRESHILSVHPVHNSDIMSRMDDDDCQAFGQWLMSRRDPEN